MFVLNWQTVASVSPVIEKLTSGTVRDGSTLQAQIFRSEDLSDKIYLGHWVILKSTDMDSLAVLGTGCTSVIVVSRTELFGGRGAEQLAPSLHATLSPRSDVVYKCGCNVVDVTLLPRLYNVTNSRAVWMIELLIPVLYAREPRQIAKQIRFRAILVKIR